MRKLSQNYAYNAKYATEGPYQTPLSASEEYGYREWVGHLNSFFNRGLDPDDPSYDMRGFYKDQVRSGQWSTKGFTGTTHFPDTYKTPYHPTFSRESRYALPTAPYWKGEQLLDPVTQKPTAGYAHERARERTRE